MSVVRGVSSVEKPMALGEVPHSKSLQGYEQMSLCVTVWIKPVALGKVPHRESLQGYE
eukprot:CAMPEP_0174265826 /NCGR_PEP_ID=MMETSP0439-20130205/28072_1 /TAXON_ID=0 /ORGANISM="Stereomyxa ramosa, Strain Chinc5" /LENGTH=57 /DNA_ID=CAMNT_0015352481 /DNA_START=18 /DNA_END=188 /DNA_ORIENTATION=-